MDEQLSARDLREPARLPDGDAASGPSSRPRCRPLSNDGRTYTFRIRRGFRFSPPSNEPVTAETFRHTIERTLSPVRAGLRTTRRTSSGRVPRSRRGSRRTSRGSAPAASTLTITLVRPAGDFLRGSAMPAVLPGAALDAARPEARARAASLGRAVLLRLGRRAIGSSSCATRTTAGDRPRRAARIVITDDVPTPKAVALVDSGQLDYLPTDFSPPARAGRAARPALRPGKRRARARAGSASSSTPSRCSTLVVFNTQRPLFRDARLRQAVELRDRPARARARVLRRAASSGSSRRLPGYGRGGVYPLAARPRRRPAGWPEPKPRQPCS